MNRKEQNSWHLRSMQKLQLLIFWPTPDLTKNLWALVCIFIKEDLDVHIRGNIQGAKGRGERGGGGVGESQGAVLAQAVTR